VIVSNLLYLMRRSFSNASKQKLRALQISCFRWLFDIPVAILFGRNLKVLATLYGSDKWNIHWYAQHYETHFRPIRGKRLTVLEIGIGGYDDPTGGGGSLRMWRSWFPRARIHGIDICDKSAHSERRITIHQGSQADTVFLQAVIDKIGRPDVIVDDGSHENADVIATFQFLFPLLADDGHYVVEDTQTSYWPGGSITERNSPATTMGFFKSLVDGLNWEEYFGDYEPTSRDLQITAIFFYHNLVIIKKGNNREGSNNRRWHQHREEWKALSRTSQAEDGKPLPAIAKTDFVR
jgi:hypothetical protein